MHLLFRHARVATPRILTSGIRLLAACLMLAPALLSACTSSPTPGERKVSAPVQPRVATYRCDEGVSIRIENFGSTVRVHPPADDPAAGNLAAAPGDPPGAVPQPVELAAAPPGQYSRYGADGYALVLEGGEALWMDSGEPPLTCVR